MHRYAVGVLCFVSMFAGAVDGQKTTIDPVAIPAGTVLTFHLQTRLAPDAGDEIDMLPKGTAVRVKVLKAIDSAVDADGSEFRGLLVSPLTSGDHVIVHSDAQAQGILALLRSHNHPEGFRYELLLTRITDQGKTYELTASLNPSLLDTAPTTTPTSAEPAAVGR
jgi:hypothetical protein